MHLLQFKPKLPATDKFYSGFGNIFLQKAYHRHMDTYALKEHEFSACAVTEVVKGGFGHH